MEMQWLCWNGILSNIFLMENLPFHQCLCLDTGRIWHNFCLLRKQQPALKAVNNDLIAMLADLLNYLEYSTPVKQTAYMLLL